MSVSNWIELVLLLCICTIGIVLKIRNRRKVRALDGAEGIVKKSQLKGDTIGIATPPLDTRDTQT